MKVNWNRLDKFPFIFALIMLSVSTGACFFLEHSIDTWWEKIFSRFLYFWFAYNVFWLGTQIVEVFSKRLHIWMRTPFFKSNRTGGK